ncbi:MAG: tetratricopeptide repeat protein [Pseudomonadota bacterium]
MTRNNKAKEMYTEAMGAFVAGNYTEAIRLLGAAVTEDDAFSLAFVSRGAAHLKLSRPIDAIADFDRAISIGADNARAYHLRGLAREIQGNDTAAEADFDRAIALNPEYSAAYFSRASLLSKTGREEAAVEDIQMVAHFSEHHLGEFAAENNVWRSHHLTVEAAMETELNR